MEYSMVSILLTILKILGISLSVILGILVVLLLLVLFVPVRYRFSGSRRAEGEGPFSFQVKVTWLLHLINVAFSYPDAPYLKVRIACMTLFRSDKTSARKDGGDAPSPKEKRRKDKTGKAPKEQTQHGSEGLPDKEIKERSARKEGDSLPKAETEEKKSFHSKEDCKPQSADRSPKEPELEAEEKPEPDCGAGEEDDAAKTGFFKKLIEFTGKLKAAFKNIRYTIAKICDKIKHIVNNIQYYTEIIRSETFGRAFKVCSGQVFSLLKHILPGKVEGSLHIGTGDPASTGQVLAVYGMLYPFIGNHIDIQPDFEQQIIEGELLIKGRITVCKALKTAWIIYFNKDLRRLIKLFKREAA